MGYVADEANSGSAETAAAADPGTVFSALAEIIYQGSESSQIYAAICVAATRVVTGCDHASLLVRRDGRYVTVGASDRIFLGNGSTRSSSDIRCHHRVSCTTGASGRLDHVTWRKSPVRTTCTLGSAREALGNHRLYSTRRDAIKGQDHDH